MKEIRKLNVKYHGRTVGTLAETRERKVAFQYDREWIESGFSVSPFSLPLESRVFIPAKDVFDGLFGVFADSLPDGWGRLLVDRVLLSRQVAPVLVSPLTRLGIVGKTGMGALEYVPELTEDFGEIKKTFDEMAIECEKILKEKESKDLDMLFQLGGSSGGARPKVLICIDGEDWIVKFPSSYDWKNIGLEEYRYMKCARKCGIRIPDVRLFPSKLCEGYYGVKRFDRTSAGKKHMITVSGLLETSHRIPNLDYLDLMKLTCILTKDYRECEELYRRMCFNVYAHNRDDHSKNFTYVYEEKEGRWILSPAYDLTYSSSVGGWHATCVNGNGQNPGIKDLIAVGEKAGISEAQARKTALKTEEIVKEGLGDMIRKHES